MNLKSTFKKAGSTLLILAILVVAYFTFFQSQQSIPEYEAPEGSEYMGEVMAGTSAPYIDFNPSDYESAKQSDKLVILYFYADWCPLCRREVPKLKAAFDGLTTDQVIGFQVNYNDKFTDDFEREIAREYGVAYQHTKVFLQNGERVLKSPETWDKARYLEEIDNFLQ